MIRPGRAGSLARGSRRARPSVGTSGPGAPAGSLAVDVFCLFGFLCLSFVLLLC